jgi:primosomal protein N' (replication factor Y)
MATTALKKWYCEVAPLTSLPLTRGQFLTYSSETPVSIGSLVSVSVGPRTLNGVVFSVRSFDMPTHFPFRIKKISKVLQENFLTKEQLLLAEYISKEYFTSLGRCLVHFTPAIAKSRATLLVPESLASPLCCKAIFELTEEQKKAINHIATNTNKPCYVFGPASSGKTEVYIRAIKAKQLANSTAQALVLVPELTLIAQEIHRYREAFGNDSVIVMHSHLSPGAFYTAWGKITRGEASVILGTRQALFAPFANLACVVVDEEQDNAYKQWDMNPRYDARRVAEELARLHSATLVFGSATPSIERFHETVTGKYTRLTLSPLPKQPKATITLVNLRFEKRPKQFSMLSQELIDGITITLKNKRQVLLFINRQGASAFSVCDQCKTILRCPDCDRALVFDTEAGVYHCLHCRHKSSAFPQCHKCQSMVFKNIGTGTQKVEKEIQKRFPFTKIARIDRQTMQKKGAQEKIFAEFASGETEILIGTQMATKGWDLPRVAFIGMIDADSLFSFPDFLTDENAFQHILQAAGRMARMGSCDGTALIQTFYPENPTLQKVVARDYLALYHEMIEQREPLFYPPFGRLIKIVFQDELLKKVERAASKAFTLLSEIATHTRALRISEPQTPLIGKARLQFRKHIIVRCKDATLPDELQVALRKLASTASIDIDPISLA